MRDVIAGKLQNAEPAIKSLIVMLLHDAANQLTEAARRLDNYKTMDGFDRSNIQGALSRVTEVQKLEEMWRHIVQSPVLHEEESEDDND